jgi:cytochrome c-type biogenesis protein CcmE
VTDGASNLAVVYEGLLPDLFREGQGVVAEGKLRPDGVFAATTVLAKHDENYMPREVVDALKQSGHWQEDGATKAAAGPSTPILPSPATGGGSRRGER